VEKPPLRSLIPRKVVEVLEQALLYDLLKERKLQKKGAKDILVDRLFNFQSRKSLLPEAAGGQMQTTGELNSLITRCQQSKVALEVIV
jgi:hypothetical protein